MNQNDCYDYDSSSRREHVTVIPNYIHARRVCKKLSFRVRIKGNYPVWLGFMGSGT